MGSAPAHDVSNMVSVQVLSWLSVSPSVSVKIVGVMVERK